MEGHGRGEGDGEGELVINEVHVFATVPLFPKSHVNYEHWLRGLVSLISRSRPAETVGHSCPNL
jgi:hypothetical protein